MYKIAWNCLIRDVTDRPTNLRHHEIVCFDPNLNFVFFSNNNVFILQEQFEFAFSSVAEEVSAILRVLSRWTLLSSTIPAALPRHRWWRGFSQLRRHSRGDPCFPSHQQIVVLSSRDHYSSRSLNFKKDALSLYWTKFLGVKRAVMTCNIMT